ncbi:hypothetical protein CBP27_04805 [Fischerella thermalis WC542]|nr:hypothetical protein CBP30_22305 [Fischerella thermalis WC157]PLZ41984.1 hypothetical protein CBP27_04805 [Fischerella thermalis WC542]PLZ77821.1 hypothetical protein CBP16_20285 [Fischerella thermalis WC217]
MILFSLLIEKLNCWRSWHLPCGKPLRVYGGSLYPAGSRYASTSPFYATPNFINQIVLLDHIILIISIEKNIHFDK